MTARNVIVTMLLGGLWHGAGWNFVAWGAMHGVGIAAEQQFGLRRAALRGGMAWLGCLVLTQVWVTLAWVFFRAPDSGFAARFIWHMIPGTGASLPSHRIILIPLVCALPVVAHNLFPLALARIPRRKLGVVLGALTAVLLVLNFIIFSPERVFIYFRF